MAAEIVAALADAPAGWVVDATAGGGGHSAAILAARADVRILALDRDPTAVEAATARLSEFGDRVQVVHGRFSTLAAECASRGIDGLAGLVADLGVSSHQLDVVERGFSFRGGGPLDMRMDPTQGPTLAERLKRTSHAELADVLYHYGEVRNARRLARELLEGVGAGIVDTAALAEHMASVTRGPRGRIHPATKVFQALRIWLNDEEGELDQLLADGPTLLRSGGAMALLSFHSGEDRMVKRRFRELGAGRRADYERPGKQPMRPTDDEVARNPRARSARLRVLNRRRQEDEVSGERRTGAKERS